MASNLSHTSSWEMDREGSVHINQTWKTGASSTSEWVKLDPEEFKRFVVWAVKQTSFGGVGA